MKTPRLKTVTALLALTATVALAQAGAPPLNSALARSPRMIEAFPELAPERNMGISATATESRSLEALKANRAYAASPRVLEAFPQLNRTPVEPSVREPIVIRNSAYAASPRVKEAFPWLSRETANTQSFEIAPLKEKN